MVQLKIRYASLEEVSKNIFMTIYNSNCTQKMFKVIAMKSYGVNK